MALFGLKADNLLDLSESKLPMQGTKGDRDDWSKRIDEYVQNLTSEKNERISANNKRHDFYEGQQGDYSNIFGIIRDTKQKKGHTNQVTNYAGKTVVKMAYALANNPPKMSVASLDDADWAVEGVRAQAIEEYIDSVLNSPVNRFWKKTYRRACFIQGEYGDAAIKTYLVEDEIKICNQDNMSNLMVIWNGEDAASFDAVIAENYMTPELIEENFGIKVNRKKLPQADLSKASSSQGTWSRGQSNNWATTNTLNQTNKLPTGKSNVAKLKVLEYDSEDHYIIKIENEIVEFVEKDDTNFPKVKFWTIVPNIPNPPSPWSIADIDYLFDIQLELNDNDNRTADYIRVGGVQRYVAYNMTDFDPESIKTSSGQVIFVNDPDGRSKFEPLPTNINNFPADQYHARKLNQMYDLGLPKVAYGASGGDSGRSKALDYQSSIDVTIFKRDGWELAMQDICAKIQIFGNFLLGKKVDWFKDKMDDFVVRNMEFDWTDPLPVSQSDKVVNVLNKFTMGIPLRQAYKELGYRNPESLLQQLKQEMQDPNMMILRAKAWQYAEGLLKAMIEAQNQMPPPVQPQAQGTQPPAPNPNQAGPVLTSSQNTQSARPMSQRGGTTAYSSAAGLLDRTRQNQAAAVGG